MDIGCTARRKPARREIVECERMLENPVGGLRVENYPVGAEIGPPSQLIRGFAHVTEWHLEEAN